MHLPISVFPARALALAFAAGLPLAGLLLAFPAAADRSKTATVIAQASEDPSDRGQRPRASSHPSVKAPPSREPLAPSREAVGSEDLKVVPPTPEAEERRRIGPNQPATSGRERPRDLEFVRVPVIEGVLFNPEGGGTDPGVLAPGGLVAIYGSDLGSRPGRIVIKGTNNAFGTDYRYGEVELIELRWEDSKHVSGRIPTNISRPIERVQVDLRVYREDGKVSAPKSQLFEVPSDTRWLGFDDTTIEECGLDSNSNYCNDVEVVGKCGIEIFVSDFAPEQGAAIEGYHRNCSGAVGDDAGTDEYKISLEDGWVFDKLLWKGKRPKPDFPKGGTHWVPRFRWDLTPGSELHYWAKIRVRRPR